MKKRSLIIFVALALVPLILLAQISSPGSYSSVIMTFLRSTTAAAARAAIGAGTGSTDLNFDTTQFTTTSSTNFTIKSGATMTNTVFKGSTSGQVSISSAGLIDSTVVGNILKGSGATAQARFLDIANTTGRVQIGTDGATPAIVVGGVTYGTSLATVGSTPIQFGVNNAFRAIITSTGVGVETTAPDKSLEVNSATGAVFRGTYNDSNGSAANYFDLSVSSAGDLTVAPSGLDTSFTGRTASTPTSSTLAAAATAIAVTANVMTITGDAGANTVATITGGLSGQILTLIFADSLVTITDDATATANTVNLSAAFTSTSNDTLTLVFNGTSWREVARSVN